MNIQVANLGHNNGPLLETLNDSTHSMRAAVEAIAARANAAPRTIKSQNDLDTVGSLIRDTSTLNKEIEDRRKAEKDPYLNAGRQVDAFFGEMTDRLDRVKKAFQAIADDYARAKAAEERAKREEEAAKARAEEERKRIEAEEAKRTSTKERKAVEAETLAMKADRLEAAATASASDILSDSIGISARAPWTFEITDFGAIPLADLKPYFKRDEIEKAIRQYVKQGHRELKGVRIYQDVKARFR